MMLLQNSNVTQEAGSDSYLRVHVNFGTYNFSKRSKDDQEPTPIFSAEQSIRADDGEIEEQEVYEDPEEVKAEFDIKQMYCSKTVTEIKKKMQVLMNNRRSSDKIIDKLNALKVARYNNMVSRGNFISKNVSEINQSAKTKEWIDCIVTRYGDKIDHVKNVKGRNMLQ
jgi:hypothetical protein